LETTAIGDTAREKHVIVVSRVCAEVFVSTTADQTAARRAVMVR
jgi:hypothetical protein